MADISGDEIRANRLAALLNGGSALGQVDTAAPAGGGLLGGVLPAVYSYGDTMKRKLAALLADPAGTIGLGVVRAGEDDKRTSNLMYEAGYMPGSRSVLVSPEQREAARAELARYGAEQAIQMATVWHGSPHKFDSFSSSKIGTGEGAQAYGHGLYLAESPEVADQYAGKLSQQVVDFANKQPTTAAEKRIEKRLTDIANSTQYGSAYNAVRNEFQQIQNPLKDRLFGNSFVGIPPLPPRKLAETLAMQRAANRLGLPDVGDTGSLYKIDLPDEKIARMLDWDKPLSQQAPEVQTAIKNYDVSGGKGIYDPDATGAQIYNRIGASSSEKNAAETLRQQGIPGIRYLDGDSRGAGAGTSNYVVFPGEESALTILERNGTPVNRLVQALKGAP